MPLLRNLSLKPPSLTRKLSFGPRSGSAVVGLDIQPGFAAAVQARTNGSILAERAACLPLAADTVREGEVLDEGALRMVLRELFAGERLSKRVRVGVANQRTVMRTLELPPVTDRKELAAAVEFQAQDQVPMPLGNAVLDFHPLGIVETPAGPRQRVVLVAAQRDMIEHLLSAVRGAGLQPIGVDLSAFALIRALYRPAPGPEPEQVGRVVYLNVDGLTNLAIAEGTVCRFTRVVGGGLEGMAGELAERLGIALDDARAALLAVDLTGPQAVEESAVSFELGTPPPSEPASDASPRTTLEDFISEEAGSTDLAMPDLETPASPGEPGKREHAASDVETPVSAEAPGTAERALPYAEPTAVEHVPAPEAPQEAPERTDTEADARKVLENGVREISGEVRNSLDFHRSQEGGGEISHVVLSGSALDVPGFADALQGHLGLEVRAEDVLLADEGSAGTVSTHRLAVAAGLAAEEVQR
jgi:type IV pilus assembly protein PilM